MKFYKRFPGDITIKTGHLSPAEFGVYDRLLDHYYATERPLPRSTEDCCSIARTRTKDDRAAVDRVLGEFFTLTGAGWEQQRAEEMIADALPRIQAARENGKKGGRPRKPEGNGKEPSGFAEETQQEPKEEPSAKASQSQKRKEISKAAPSHPAAAAAGPFERFWKAYPRKVGKDAACKAFEKRRPTEALLQSMLDAIDAQLKTEQWQREGGQFIPHPSTWLNEGRWQDETPVPGQGAGEQWHESRAGIEAKGAALGLGRWDEDAFGHGRGPDWPTYRARVLRAAGEQPRAVG